MFESIEKIPWHEVRDSRGPASDATRWIRALDSEDPDARADAVNGFLWGKVFDQTTLYPVAPFVIPFVIEALQSRTLAERDHSCGNSMKSELLHFLRVCAQYGQRAIQGKPHPRAPTIENAIRAGVATYSTYAGDPEPAVASDARWLVAWGATGLSMGD